MRLAFLLVLAVLFSACGDDPAPPVESAPDAEVSDPGPVNARQTVYDVVSANPSLSTLAGLVQAAGLEATLRDTAQVYTLFAPSNAAFSALEPAALDSLRANPEALRARLLGHALANRTLSGDVFGEITIASIAGTDLTLDADDDGVTVSDGQGTTARVTDADLDADNGVVHIIDAVLGGPVEV